MVFVSATTKTLVNSIDVGRRHFWYFCLWGAEFTLFTTSVVRSPIKLFIFIIYKYIYHSDIGSKHSIIIL